MPVDGRRALSTWKELDCKHRLHVPSSALHMYINDDRENNPFTIDIAPF
jgi:hypothetical protein